MFQLKRLVCAVDLSEASRVALDYAAALAKQLDGSLTLLHVGASPGLAAEERDKTLEQWRADTEGALGAPVRTRVRYGEPADEILHEAEASRCDLLIVGTHGRSGISRAVLGSVAERLIRAAPCPVFVARDHAHERAVDADEAAQYR